jgi:hypothetical protein
VTVEVTEASVISTLSRERVDGGTVGWSSFVGLQGASADASPMSASASVVLSCVMSIELSP